MTPGRQIFALLLTTGGFLHIFTICFLFYYLTSFFFLPASTTNAVIATNIISTNGTARIVSAVATPVSSVCASETCVAAAEPSVDGCTVCVGNTAVVGCTVVGSVGVVGCSSSDGVVGCSFTA